MDKRKAFQGVVNIIRFNWHFYIINIVLVAIVFIVNRIVFNSNLIISSIAILILAGVLLSLIISFYIYDYSGLYKLEWLNFLEIGTEKTLLNIHAGFDETSSLLSKKYGDSKLLVFDFYDPNKHREISIKRARMVYPAYPGTKSISTTAIPVQPASIDFIFALLAVHEIRNSNERIEFFKKLTESIAYNGKIIVLEHLRDLANFIPYSIGFFHFFSKNQWKKVFNSAGLIVDTEIKITPFLSAFILCKNEAST